METPHQPSKVCRDSQCLIAGPQLLSEFPKNKRMPDLKHRYCKVCCVRRVHQARESRRERVAARERLGLSPVSTLSQHSAAGLWLPEGVEKIGRREEKVWAAIWAGARTQKQIKAQAKVETNDELGLSLSELILHLGWVKTETVRDEIRIYYPNPFLLPHREAVAAA